MAARFRPAVKREIAGDYGTCVTEPLASPFVLAKVPSCSPFESGALASLRVDDGGITSGTRVISVGVRILVIVSFSLILSRGVDYDTDIFTGDSARIDTRNSRTRADPHSLPSR